MKTKKYKCGVILLTGFPNAGKSTLLNSILKNKISIVSHKVQTTKEKISGVLNVNNSQLIFTDTPGIIEKRKYKTKIFSRSIQDEEKKVDINLFIYDLSKTIDKRLLNEINSTIQYFKNNYLILNKIDLVSKDKILECSKFLNSRINFSKTFMVSAKKGQGCKDLIDFLQTTIPVSPFLYNKDQLTDLSERVFSSEITREKLFNYLNSELPYNLYVETVIWKETKKSITIHQNINVSKYNHKRIIIGKNGENLKKIGISSRKDLEKFFNKKVNLFLFIKIKNNWMNNIKELNHLGQN